MISSVIAKLNSDRSDLDAIVLQISNHPNLEVGELVNQRSLPITIETIGSQETEEATRWLQMLEGVEFVDVVFVHFEDQVG